MKFLHVYLALIAGIVFVFALIFLFHTWSRSCHSYWQQRHLKRLHEAGYEIRVGHGDFVLESRHMHQDEPVLIIIQNAQGRAGAVIGVQLKRNAIRVGQMQGVKGIGIEVPEGMGCYLLSIVEDIAKLLKVSKVQVVRAEKNLYWDRSYELKALREHQGRLLNIYNKASQTRGYVLCGGLWQKNIVP